jgi:CheY-like chemotaxis protein
MNNYLIVDHDEDTRYLIESLIQRFENKAEIFNSTNGASVLHMAAKFKPDAIFINISFKDADALDVCNSVLSNKPTSHVPVFLYGKEFSNHTDAEKMIASGASAFFSIPIEEINFRIQFNKLKVQATKSDEINKNQSKIEINNKSKHRIIEKWPYGV